MTPTSRTAFRLATLPLALGMLAMATSLLPAQSSDRRVLFDFSDAAAGKAWFAVNDGVMGGLSEGGPKIQGDRMIFAGRTRLENNGGFSSTRSRGVTFDLNGFDGLEFVVKGSTDRTFKAAIRTNARQARRDIAYWADFSIVEGAEGWQRIRVPFSAFVPTSFGFKLKGPQLDVSKVRSLGLMMYDKKAGAFTIEVREIAAFRGDTKATAVKKGPQVSPEAAAALKALKDDGRFKTLLAAVEAAELTGALLRPEGVTVFAPTDEAFAALPEGTLDSLLKEQGRKSLKRILAAHVVAGATKAVGALQAGSVKTLGDDAWEVKLRDGRLAVGPAFVLATDVGNAAITVHVIDRVIIPTTPKPTMGPEATLAARAIELGAPRYNDGDIAACVAIYEIAVTAIIMAPEDRLPSELRARMTAALANASDQSPGDAAWTLREALDLVLSKFA